MKAWYFAAADRRLRYGDGRVAKVGITHAVDESRPPECCEYGLHGSVRALDALRLGAGPVPFRVTLGGAMDITNDKVAAHRRTYDAGGIDATPTLIEFACCAAMSAMLLAEHDDPRSWRAIEAVFAWLRGEVSTEALRKAACAACAACAAAGAAANAVAHAAANAAANAANAAANAAYAACAACAAAGAAAYAAANANAADAATRDELNALLESMLEEAMT